MKIRANKTVRSLPYLAPGTDQRKQAEAVAARVEKGETVPGIAEDLKVSLATARGFLTNLAPAQDVEAGKHATTEHVVTRAAPLRMGAECIDPDSDGLRTRGFVPDHPRGS